MTRGLMAGHLYGIRKAGPQYSPLGYPESTNTFANASPSTTISFLGKECLKLMMKGSSYAKAL